jgi:phosphatidylserine decarboxylase
MRPARRARFTLHRSAAFLRLYRFLPHALLGRMSRLVARARRPRWIVDLAVRRWIDRAAIRMEEFLPGPFVSLEAFFLRKLRPGARPIADGFVAPADGVVVSAGPIARGMILQIKGVALDLERLTRGAGPELPLAAYEGGRYVTIFLTPHGYHYVHMPIPATLIEIRWISGRAFPQNQDALRHIPRIYERNERAILRCRSDSPRSDGHEFLLILVGASLIGGIHLAGLGRATWARREPLPCERHFARGAELGHFSFGSTVVVLAPPALAGLPPFIGTELRMGQKLW